MRNLLKIEAEEEKETRKWSWKPLIIVFEFQIYWNVFGLALTLGSDTDGGVEGVQFWLTHYHAQWKPISNIITSVSFSMEESPTRMNKNNILQILRFMNHFWDHRCVFCFSVFLFTKWFATLGRLKSCFPKENNRIWYHCITIIGTFSRDSPS